jgi:hypothetical protein
MQLWTYPLPSIGNVASGTALASSTTLTDVSPAPQLTFPANFLQPGMVIRVKAAGTFSNTSTPTLLLGVYYGGVAGTALAATSAITTTTGATNWQWTVEYFGRVRTIGSSGTIMGFGAVDLGTSLTAVTHRPIPETALATVTIDTTAAKAITLGAQWGTNSASNTLTCVHFDVDIAG